jgi:hypothetical protein
MAQLILNDIDQETAEKLELRAKRLGTTPGHEVSRLLGDSLRVESGYELATTGPDEEGPDPRSVRQHGFLVFTGAIASEEIPDYRALREERVDSLLKGVDEDRL